MTDALDCRREDRRKKLFGNADWNGIDFLEVADDQMSLCVHFFDQIPRGITPDNIRITGGRRITDVEAVKVEVDSAHDPEVDDCLRITLNRFGDFSTYTLCLVDPQTGKPMAGLDPRYACLDFSFKIDCPTALDCRPDCGCPPDVLAEPDINYLAKDYASFRQIILDRLALIMPDWKERHAADIGITLIEILAYVGDYLSYYQDAVATEAYLDTARKRISVRRHARLVDYKMHEGCNARAFVTVGTEADIAPMAASDFYFITGFNAGTGGVLRQSDLEEVPPQSYVVFEPVLLDPKVTTIGFKALHSTIRIYTWGDEDCCLAKGATSATLIDMAPPKKQPDPSLPGTPPPVSIGSPPGSSDPTKPPPSTTPSPGAPALVAAATSSTPAMADTPPARVLTLQVGDILIFEEMIGPETGNPADADPRHRHAVRLTAVTQNVDGLFGVPVLDVEWAAEDALPFSLCLSTRLPSPDCSWVHDITVVRGNVVLVDHGRTVGEPLGPVGTTDLIGACSCDGAVIEEIALPASFNPGLSQGPLVFAEPVTLNASAAALFTRDPRRALPCLKLEEFVGAEKTVSGPFWAALYDLLESEPSDRVFVAEMDDDGNAQLRFGDGALGLQPAPGLTFQSTYRIGREKDGNVGRDTITYLVMRNGTPDGANIMPRNPIAASGGTAREPAADVRMLAPYAFKDVRERAITADDYAELADSNPALQRAAAELSWMGSWYEARVAVDPERTETAPLALLREVDRYLYAFRRIGHDLFVVPAQYAPLKVVLEVCVLPDYTRGQVQANLMKVFGSGQMADGTLGFFNPDNLTFGDGIYASRIVSAALAVPGVATLKIKSLKRLTGGDEDALETGVLPLGAFEIAMCDSDPNFPEDGAVTF
ncbi:MAG TPA: hypothetical protein VGM17_08940, partial [Rhizomicrobium sp.]